MKLVDLKAAFLTLMFVGGYISVIVFFTSSPWHGAIGFLGTIFGCFVLGAAIGKATKREQEANRDLDWDN